MKLYTKGFLLLVSLLLQQSGLCQHTIHGKVIDGQTKEVLPFVNIIFNNNALTGTTTDINGQFTFTSQVELEIITCSYVGYDKITLPIDPAKRDEALQISLKASFFELREVVVKAGENPANRIIRNVIANKHIHNPEKIASFSYTSYNKVIYDFDFSDTTVEDNDKLQVEKFFRGGHFFMMESVAERKFIQPDNNEEIILATKVSGFKDASFAPLATDIQPFSFYEDILTILDVGYLNPISSGSLTKYDFRLEDTLYYGVDTTFVLSFKPKPGKNFEALKGFLSINTNGYAIQNVVAKPDVIGFIDINLQQQYSFVDGKQWFPEQLKFELFVRQSEDRPVGVKASGVSMISDVKLLPDLRKRDFGLEAISMHELANKRDSAYWDVHRAIPLDIREEITYEVLDSLGEKFKFDKRLKLLERFSQNRIPIGVIDLDISKLIQFNQFEGTRVGLGVYTNDKLVKNLSLGGFAAYGFRDHQWKYGGEAILTIDKAKEVVLTARYQSTLLEIGKSRLGFFNARQFDFRTFLAAQMDRIHQSSVGLGFRALRYARVNVSFQQTRTDPQYAYTFQSDENNAFTNYTNTSLSVHLRYAYKEKLLNSMGQRISMGTKYPVLSLSYTQGFQDVLNGQLDYRKIEARLEKTLQIRNIGKSRIRLDAGYIDQPIPYGISFTGEGAQTGSFSVLVRNSFMTATPYEFLSDRYMNIHYMHDFGSLLFRIGNWRPSISVYQNMGWGALSQPEYHQGVSFKTKEKGLYESGLQLDKLIKLKYLNVAYMGFGAGAFVRYGPYATGRFGDDVVFTFSMTLSSK